MLSKSYPHPEERPFETPPAAAPQDRLARLEGRKTVMQPFLTILAQPRSAFRLHIGCPKARTLGTCVSPDRPPGARAGEAIPPDGGCMPCRIDEYRLVY